MWDHDTVGDDDLVGSLSFNWEKIEAEENSKLVWANIYGAPDNIENEAAALMNTNDKLASTWRGRLLLKLFKMESEKATLKQISIDNDHNKELIQTQFEVETDYQLRAQVFEAVNLPEKTGSYSVAFKFANVKIESKLATASGGCCK